MTHTRRQFLAAAAGLVLLPRLGRAQQPLGLLLVAPTTPRLRGLRMGMTMGYEEAASAAALLGRAVHRLELESPEDLPPDAFSGFIVGGWDEPSCRWLAREAEARGAVFLNAGCADDSLRGEHCSGHAFHVAPSQAMFADALGERAGSVVPWLPELERFGAAQLNARFRARFSEEMEGLAWAGWMAVKVAWEAWLRSGGGRAPELIAYLESGAARFDGHKGKPLSFRTWDHQLRQPLYVAGEGGEVAEVPRAAQDDERTAAQLLDTLGTGPGETTCSLD